MTDANDQINPRIKLVATPAQFELMLTRNCPGPLVGEQRLLIAVLGMAAADAQSCYREYLRSFVRKNGKTIKPWPVARFFSDECVDFWLSGRAGAIAEVIGLDAAFVVEQFIKHLGIDFEGLQELRDSDQEERTLIAITALYAQHDELESLTGGH